MPLGDATPCYPGDTPFERKYHSEGGFVSSRLTMSSHSGTHMDSPSHLGGGGQTIDGIATERFILPALLIDCRGLSAISPDLLEGRDISGKALLFRTGSPPGLSSGMPGMTPAAASLAVEMGALLTGTDAISIDPPGSFESHRILLPASIPILENLMLDGIEEGDYLLLCFPLPIEGGDGAPVRAYLQRESGT